jgi:hypothetical protein
VPSSAPSPVRVLDRRFSINRIIVVGAVLGYWNADDYNSLINVLINLSEDEKYRLQQKIQALVASASIQQFILYLKSEANRQMLMKLLCQAAKPA